STYSYNHHPPPPSTRYPYTTLFRSRRRPDDDFFRQPRQVGGRDRGDRQELQREIAVRNAVQRIARRLAETERRRAIRWTAFRTRSEEHTSELQSRENLVCRLLLEKI